MGKGNKHKVGDLEVITSNNLTDEQNAAGAYTQAWTDTASQEGATITDANKAGKQAARQYLKSQGYSKEDRREMAKSLNQNKNASVSNITSEEYGNGVLAVAQVGDASSYTKRFNSDISTDLRYASGTVVENGWNLGNGAVTGNRLQMNGIFGSRESTNSAWSVREYTNMTSIYSQDLSSRKRGFSFTQSGEVKSYNADAGMTYFNPSSAVAQNVSSRRINMKVNGAVDSSGYLRPNEAYDGEQKLDAADLRVGELISSTFGSTMFNDFFEVTDSGVKTKNNYTAPKNSSGASGKKSKGTTGSSGKKSKSTSGGTGYSVSGKNPGNKTPAEVKLLNDKTLDYLNGKLQAAKQKYDKAIKNLEDAAAREFKRQIESYKKAIADANKQIKSGKLVSVFFENISTTHNTDSDHASGGGGGSFDNSQSKGKPSDKSGKSSYYEVIVDGKPYKFSDENSAREFLKQDPRMRDEYYDTVTLNSSKSSTSSSKTQNESKSTGSKAGESSKLPGMDASSAIIDSAKSGSKQSGSKTGGSGKLLGMDASSAIIDSAKSGSKQSGSKTGGSGKLPGMDASSAIIDSAKSESAPKAGGGRSFGNSNSSSSGSSSGSSGRSSGSSSGSSGRSSGSSSGSSGRSSGSSSGSSGRNSGSSSGSSGRSSGSSSGSSGRSSGSSSSSSKKTSDKLPGMEASYEGIIKRHTKAIRQIK